MDSLTVSKEIKPLVDTLAQAEDVRSQIEQTRAQAEEMESQLAEYDMANVLEEGSMEQRQAKVMAMFTDPKEARKALVRDARRHTPLEYRRYLGWELDRAKRGKTLAGAFPHKPNPKIISMISKLKAKYDAEYKRLDKIGYASDEKNYYMDAMHKKVMGGKLIEGVELEEGRAIDGSSAKAKADIIKKIKSGEYEVNGTTDTSQGKSYVIKDFANNKLIHVSKNKSTQWLDKYDTDKGYKGNAAAVRKMRAQLRKKTWGADKPSIQREDVESDEARTLRTQEVKSAKQHLRKWMGKRQPGAGLKWGQKVKYKGKAYLVYDFNADSGEPKGMSVALVSPDFKSMIQAVSIGSLKEDVELAEAKQSYHVRVKKYFRGIGDPGRIVQANSEKEAIKIGAKLLKRKPSYLDAQLIEADEDGDLEEARGARTVTKISPDNVAKLTKGVSAKSMPAKAKSLYRQMVSVRKNDPGYAPQRVGATVATDDIVLRIALQIQRGKAVSDGWIKKQVEILVKKHQLFPEWYSKELFEYAREMRPLVQGLGLTGPQKEDVELDEAYGQMDGERGQLAQGLRLAFPSHVRIGVQDQISQVDPSSNEGIVPPSYKGDLKKHYAKWSKYFARVASVAKRHPKWKGMQNAVARAKVVEQAFKKVIKGLRVKDWADLGRRLNDAETALYNLKEDVSTEENMGKSSRVEAVRAMREQLVGGDEENSASDEHEEACKTPGRKLRSKGKGRGLAKGKGKGPLGVPMKDKEEEVGDMEGDCKTPGRKLRSKGKGRGLAKGKGKGPLGIPIGDKEGDVDLDEAQKVDPALTHGREEPGVRPGAFKVSGKLLKLWKKHGIEHPEKLLFKSQREYISKIPRTDLPQIWGKKDMADAQDVIARDPKKALRMWMRNIGKVLPKFKKAIRYEPSLIPLWFYATVVRVSGRDMADIILQRYFTTPEKVNKLTKLESAEDVELDEASWPDRDWRQFSDSQLLGAAKEARDEAARARRDAKRWKKALEKEPQGRKQRGIAKEIKKNEQAVRHQERELKDFMVEIKKRRLKFNTKSRIEDVDLDEAKLNTKGNIINIIGRIRKMSTDDLRSELPRFEKKVKKEGSFSTSKGIVNAINKELRERGEKSESVELDEGRLDAAFGEKEKNIGKLSSSQAKLYEGLSSGARSIFDWLAIGEKPLKTTLGKAHTELTRKGLGEFKSTPAWGDVAGQRLTKKGKAIAKILFGSHFREDVDPGEAATVDRLKAKYVDQKGRA